MQTKSNTAFPVGAIIYFEYFNILDKKNELIFVSQTDRLVLSLPDWIRRK